MGVARHVLRAAGAHLRVHLGARALGRAHEIELVLLHDPARHVAAVVGLQVLGGEGLHCLQQRRVDALGGRHQLVVERRRQLAGGRFPAHAPFLHGLGAAVARDGARHVVVVARLGLPARVHPRIEGPVGQVDAAHAVGERGLLQPVGRKPAAAVPLADGLAHLRLGVGEGQQAFGIDGVAGLGVRHDRRRPAELAALRHARGFEERDGLAALTLHRRAVLLPAAIGVGDGPQRQGQVVLLHERPVARELRRRHRAAVRAHERLLGGVPVRLGAASRAVVLVERRHLRCRGRRYRRQRWRKGRLGGH